jgi:hypothetical protein
MTRWNGFARIGLIVLAVTATLTACSALGDLTISNEGSSDVTVSTGDEEITVSAGGAVIILGSGCTPGDIIVEFASDQKVVVNGPVCPDEQLVVLDSKVEVRPSQ